MVSLSTMCKISFFFLPILNIYKDINTIAAGGGSRLFFHSMFIVGPESAGSYPGNYLQFIKVFVLFLNQTCTQDQHVTEIMDR